jgi:hypothetical protein
VSPQLRDEPFLHSTNGRGAVQNFFSGDRERAILAMNLFFVGTPKLGGYPELFRFFTLRRIGATFADLETALVVAPRFVVRFEEDFAPG